MVEKVIRFWNSTAIPIALTFYYIVRYGLKGAERKVDERLERLRKELIEIVSKCN